MFGKTMIGVAAVALLAGTAQAGVPKGWKTYTDAKGGWSISYPANFKLDKNHTVPSAPSSKMRSVGFLVPDSYIEGTNLNEATISIDTLPGRNCKPGQFADPVENETIIDADGRAYRSAESSDAGMSQYYATSIFVVDKTCLTVRYFTHSTNRMVIEPPPKEFDAKKLERLFDSIRATLVLRK